MPMPDEYTEEDAPFTPEPCICQGTKVFTLDRGLRFFRVYWGPENGLTELQARHWAALFAQAPTMFRFIERLAKLDHHLTNDYWTEAIRLLQDCEPKPKGRPFKRHPEADEATI